MRDEKTEKSRLGIWWTVIPVAVFGSVVLLVLWGVLGLYVFGQDTLPVRMIARVFPLPAASVDGEFISFAEWNADTRAFVALAEQGRISITGAVSRQEIARNVLDRLIRNRVLLSLADERGITVTDLELEAEYDKVAADPEQEEILRTMLTALGWSEAKLKQIVVKPILIGRRLEERLGSAAAADRVIKEATDKAEVRIFVNF